MNIEKLIKENKGTVVDVRSPGEFQGGNVSGSINIPLQEINNRIDELKSLAQPLILCCASGGRSGMATQVLSQSGIECGNAGSWLDVKYYKD
ncbi:rhodanese-like domain-containing protein [Crocinitomicaceae bacterium]|mgnify:FL=1|jgi:phage shock protein E|nr:rhodanese-like domain-containing protein [Crocinitomicaceae bacterium]